MTPNNSVAVSIPIHDWTPHLKAVLGSLKAQSVDLEIAVMMTKEDPRILADLENSGLNFYYTRIGPDKGQSDAIAEGWANTQSPILAWLNTDDALTGDVLPDVLSTFEQDPRLDVLYGHSTISNENGTILGLHPAVEPIGPLLRRTNIISQPSCFFRRKAVNAIHGINRDLQYSMDWDLWLRLYETGSKFHFSDRVLSNVTWATETKTASLNWSRTKEIASILRRTQSMYKTAIGLLALYRSHRSTYRGDQNLEANCTPFNVSTPGKTYPVVNMHRGAKNRLRVKHAKHLLITSPDQFAVKVNSNGEITEIGFEMVIGPGEAVTLSFEGHHTKIHSIEWI